LTGTVVNVARLDVVAGPSPVQGIFLTGKPGSTAGGCRRLRWSRRTGFMVTVTINKLTVATRKATEEAHPDVAPSPWQRRQKGLKCVRSLLDCRLAVSLTTAARALDVRAHGAVLRPLTITAKDSRVVSRLGRAIVRYSA